MSVISWQEVSYYMLFTEKIPKTQDILQPDDENGLHLITTGERLPFIHLIILRHLC